MNNIDRTNATRKTYPFVSLHHWEELRLIPWHVNVFGPHVIHELNKALEEIAVFSCTNVGESWDLTKLQEKLVHTLSSTMDICSGPH